jgi:hypothetical protein
LCSLFFQFFSPANQNAGTHEPIKIRHHISPWTALEEREEAAVEAGVEEGVLVQDTEGALNDIRK